MLNLNLAAAGVSSHRRCTSRISEYPHACYSPSGRIGRLGRRVLWESGGLLFIGVPYTAYTARPELCKSAGSYSRS